MLRTTVMVLATVAAISGGLSADALARAAAHRGWDGLGDGGADAIVPIPARDQILRISSAANADTTRGGTGAPITAP
jgi:hypothetical protein